MKYIFWQNILSIHQSAFIRSLAERNDVTIIVEKDIDNNRKKSGWTIPDFGNAKIIFKRNDFVLDDFFIDNQIVHVFTGIKSFPFVFKAFKLAYKYKARIIVQSEPYNWVYGKVLIRKVKYIYLQLKYGKRVNAILTISNHSKICYKKASFREEKLIPWAYFTEKKMYKSSVIDNFNNLPRLVFIGSIDFRKNLLPVLPIISKYEDCFDEFAIYGNGNLMNEVKEYEGNKIKIYGNIPNNEIHEKIARADFLILPSLYDGWGAVINEALMVGTKVLCSSNCGASDLIAENRGLIFNISPNNFEEKFLQLLKKGKTSENERENIINWSNRNISGKVASGYFEEIINHLFNNGKKPIAPWIKK